MKLAESVRKAKRTYLCGNGGSAANAIHIANDLVSVGIRAQALTDIATLTAIANDYSYGAVFSRQLKVFAEPGDLLIALSGSGNSPNIVEALEAAKEKGMETWAIVGAYQKTRAEGLADNTIKSGEDMQSAERHQITIGHRLMKWLRDLKGS